MEAPPWRGQPQDYPMGSPPPAGFETFLPSSQLCYDQEPFCVFQMNILPPPGLIEYYINQSDE